MPTEENGIEIEGEEKTICFSRLKIVECQTHETERTQWEHKLNLTHYCRVVCKYERGKCSARRETISFKKDEDTILWKAKWRAFALIPGHRIISNEIFCRSVHDTACWEAGRERETSIDEGEKKKERETAKQFVTHFNVSEISCFYALYNLEWWTNATCECVFGVETMEIHLIHVCTQCVCCRFTILNLLSTRSTADTSRHWMERN